MLDFHGTTHCIDRTTELDQCPVTGGLDDATAMLCNFGINEFAPVRLKRCDGTLLINAHQTAISGDIGGEDGSQPPFDTFRSHEIRPDPPNFG
jgi:hypothetical protein